MRSGVGGLLLGDPAQITSAHAAVIRDLGFTGASVMLPDPEGVSKEVLTYARQTLADAGVHVARANARYPSIVDADPERRAEGIRLAQRACVGAHVLNADFLLIRPCSLNLTGDWRPHPSNHTAETEARLVDSLAAVCTVASSEGVTIGLECGSISSLDSPCAGPARDRHGRITSSPLQLRPSQLRRDIPTGVRHIGTDRRHLPPRLTTSSVPT